MNLIRLLLRIIIVISYFLPFTFFLVTCNGNDVRIAYNKAEAVKNELIQKQIQQEQAAAKDSLVSKDSLLSELENDQSRDTALKTASPKNEPLFSEKFEKFVIAPTDSSLSGIGSAVYFKNTPGRFFISCSIFLSIVTFIFWRLLTRKKLHKLTQLLNIFCAVGFIITCFASDVAILFGTWILLALLVLQLIVNRKKIS
jgi:hypothetical protein